MVRACSAVNPALRQSAGASFVHGDQQLAGILVSTCDAPWLTAVRCIDDECVLHSEKK